jgi:hypothetical protein
MVVPLARKSGEICTAQLILQPISFKSDRLLNSQEVFRSNKLSKFIPPITKEINMKKLLLAAVLAVTIGLTGCAATVDRTSSTGASTAAPVQPVTDANASKSVLLSVAGSKEVTASKDFQTIADEIQRGISEKLVPAGATLKMDAGAALPTTTTPAAAGTKVVVTVLDYRYVSTGMRFAFGIMTGNAYINAKIELFDLQSGKKLTEQVFNTSSSAFQGIFSAMTAKQVDALGDEVLALVRPRG